ncbi:MAG: ribosomal protein [Candidatus Parcubacteria bacterium]|jgi:large subunit ribosomal protein L24
MRIKKGDNVKVMAGKDKGKTGKVMQVFPERDRVVVEGVNAMTKHLRTRGADAKGQKVEFSGPVRASNVLLVCPKCAKPTRIGVKTVGDKKLRACKKCGETIE